MTALPSNTTHPDAPTAESTKFPHPNSAGQAERRKPIPHAFPSGNSVTVICFQCKEELFMSSIVKEGVRRNEEGELDKWFLCRDCRDAFRKKHAAKTEEGQWIKTSMGWILMGPKGSASDLTLRRRRSRGTWLGESKAYK